MLKHEPSFKTILITWLLMYHPTSVEDTSNCSHIQWPALRHCLQKYFRWCCSWQACSWQGEKHSIHFMWLGSWSVFWCRRRCQNAACPLDRRARGRLWVSSLGRDKRVHLAVIMSDCYSCKKNGVRGRELHGEKKYFSKKDLANN